MRTIPSSLPALAAPNGDNVRANANIAAAQVLSMRVDMDFSSWLPNS
jgi:hypothetical protein